MSVPHSLPPLRTPCCFPFKLQQSESEPRSSEEPEKEPPRPQRRRSTGSSDSESDTELAELLKHVARRTAEFDPAAAAQTDAEAGQQVTHSCCGQ